MYYKKILLIPILAASMACAANISVAPVSALYQDEQGNKWWSVDELLQYADEVDAEEEALCGQDRNCKEELFFSKLDTHDQKYESLDMFRQQQFWLTSINPGAEKIDMIYFDQDPFLKRMGIDKRDPLRYVYIAWSLQGRSHINNIDPNLPLEPQIDASDTQVVYAGNSAQFGRGGFPANQVFSLPINSTNLSSNTNGYMLANTFGHSSYNASTNIFYSSCLESPSYINGDSCDLMFSAEQGRRYLPHSLVSQPSNSNNGNQGESTDEQAPDSPSGGEPGSSQTNGADSEAKTDPDTNTSKNNSSVSIERPQTAQKSNNAMAVQPTITATSEPTKVYPSTDGEEVQQIASDNNSRKSEHTSTSSKDEKLQPLAETIELPATGSFQSKCEREIAFPWWLVLVLLASDVVILWFFWPKNRKKVEKNY